MTPKSHPSAVSAASAAQAEILSYRHAERRKNNPEVGMVTPATDADDSKTTWHHDAHLEPRLQWTGKAERLSFQVDNRKLAVKIVDDRGIESLKIVNLED